MRYLFRLFIASILLLTKFALAANQTVDLTVAYKTVHFAGQSRQAIAVNNQIPAPTLHFKEGDTVTINVTNHLDKPTSIHWHGILVPWQMDGVDGISQKPIPPGGVFHYHFTLHQSGTYWYHAHVELQEQKGLYGALIIDPPHSPSYHYNKDYTIILSDWSNTPAEGILANLKKDGDYYSPRFPLQPSLMKFIHDYQKADPAEREALWEDYRTMQHMRMSIYDLSDVAYDAYLLNGHTKVHPWTGLVKQGDTVRLRFIGAAGSTIYNIKIPGTSMKVVHIDGNDVVPYSVKDFSLAPGETYDVLVTIKKTPTIIYAESIDTLGKAYGALITTPNQSVDYATVQPFPEPLPVTREMMKNMMASEMSMDNSASQEKSMTSVSMSHLSHQPMAPMKTPTKASTSKKTMNHMDMDMPEMNHSAMSHDMPMENVSQPNTTSSAEKTDKTMMSSLSQGMEGMSMSTMDMETTSSQAPEPTVSASSQAVSKKHNTEKAPMNMTMDMPGMSHNNDMASMPMSEKSTHQAKNSQAKSHTSMTDMPSNEQPSQSATTDNAMSMMPMTMPTEPTIIGDKEVSPTAHLLAIQTAGTKYQSVIAAVPTNDPSKPVDKVIRMELFGYMGRYIWFVNGLPEYKVPPIEIKPNQRYRIIFTNNSMMRHPMHIHGHWFILRNGHEKYDPLLHTVEVPPGATAVLDLDTDASGQWFFHCHHAYHMISGMSRVFQYDTIIEVTQGKAKPEEEVKKGAYVNRPIIREDEVMPLDPTLVQHPMAHPMGLYQASFLDVGEDPFNNDQEMTFKGLYGSDYNKLELYANEAEIDSGTVDDADVDIFYWHLMNQFWAIKGGANYFYRPAQTPYWQPGIGLEGLMPYFIDTNVRVYYHDSSVKLDAELSRDSQMTNNFFIRTGIRSILATKTVTQSDIGSGLNQMRYTVRPYYRLMPGVNLFAQWEYDQNVGEFKTLCSSEGECTSGSVVTFGVSTVF